MQCEEVREQFADYIAGRQGSVQSSVSEHLAACPACLLEFDELRKLWLQLETVPPAEPGAGMRPRFELMLGAYRDGLTRRPRHWWRPVLEIAAAAAALLMGIGIGYRMQAPASTSPEIEELRNELSQTRQMVALSLMQQQSATDRLKGVNWSYHLQEPGGDVLKALLDTLMHDPNVNVRLATVDALRQFGNQPSVRRGVIEAMSRQESPMVQIALIDLAVDLHEKESVKTLKQFTEDQT